MQHTFYLSSKDGPDISFKFVKLPYIKGDDINITISIKIVIVIKNCYRNVWQS